MTKKGRLKKIAIFIIGIVAFFFLLFYFLPNIFSLFSSDIAPIDDSDLRLEKVTVPQNENSYYDLIKIEDVIYIPEGKSDFISDHLAGKIWDEKFVEEILFKNREALGYFSIAANKQSFQDPAFSDPEKIGVDTVLPSANIWRKIARLSRMRVLFL